MSSKEVHLLQQANIKEYINKVCEQIRWKKAHCVIAEEIENHITDQRDAYISKGTDEEVATEQAIKEMGDPIQVGTGLDRIHRPKAEWGLIALIGITLLIGVIVRIFVTSSDSAYYNTNILIFSILGICGFAVAYFVDFTIIGKIPKTLFFATLALTILAFIKSTKMNGQAQYVPLILLIFPTIFAGILYNLRTRGYKGIILSVFFFIIPIVIAIYNANYSSAIICFFASLITANLAITKNWFKVNKLKAYLTFNISAMGLSTAYLYFFTNMIGPYFRQLINSNDWWYFLNFIHNNFLNGARFFGQGSGLTDFIDSYGSQIQYPYANNYFLSYLIYRLGWISFIVIMSLLVTFIVYAFKLCSKQKSVLGRLVSLSVLVTFTLQVALYVASNLGFQLFSTLGLPLLSYGNTSLVINMVLLGVMLSVFKSGDVCRDNLIKPIFRRRKSDLST